MQEINTFKNLERDNLVEAWERFHEMLRRCPYHKLIRWMQVYTFYNSLSDSTITVIDALAGSTLMKKTMDQAYRIGSLTMFTSLRLVKLA